jgi:hypothetical protein
MTATGTGAIEVDGIVHQVRLTQQDDHLDIEVWSPLHDGTWTYLTTRRGALPESAPITPQPIRVSLAGEMEIVPAQTQCGARLASSDAELHWCLRPPGHSTGTVSAGHTCGCGAAW